MPRLTSLADLALSEFAARFEGRDHGAGISFFVSRHPPGTGPRLHRHPYDETFLIRQGRAAFTVEGETLEVGEGEIVVVPAGAAHSFAASGEEELSQISISSSDHMITEWLDG